MQAFSQIDPFYEFRTEFLHGARWSRHNTPSWDKAIETRATVEVALFV